MSLSRRALLGVLPLSTVALRSIFAAAEAGQSRLIERFYADLLAVMKEAKRLSFAARYDRLAPSVSRTFDLALMTRIAIGPGWAQIAADQQQRLTDVFSRYTISVYANRFELELLGAPTTRTTSTSLASSRAARCRFCVA